MGMTRAMGYGLRLNPFKGSAVTEQWALAASDNGIKTTLPDARMVHDSSAALGCCCRDY